MKFKFLNQQTMPSGGGGRGGAAAPKINFGKAGGIHINKAAVELFEIAPGDKISLAQDEEDEENWYLFKDAKNGFLCRKKNKRDSSNGDIQINNKALQTAISNAYGLDPASSHNFLVAGTPTVNGTDKTKYWGLILRRKV